VPDTILVVEDEYATLEMLALLLGQAGYRVLQAADGEEALARLEEQRPDLVVTDYWMPRMDGVELCRRMEADPRWRDIPVIMMSATTLEEPRPPRVVAFLSKPLLFGGLTEALAKALRR
jgi:CheY-like chemotaxis protein